MNLFDIKEIVIEVLGYQISYVELIGTSFGLLSVYYATKANILTWATGIINEIFLFILFFQVQLYADMLLQVYFMIITLYGWYSWKKNTVENTISNLKLRSKLLLVLSIVIFTLLFGFLFHNIHLYLPMYFKVPAAYPFIDSIVMVSSIVATALLAKKKIENWYLWIIIDVTCVVLYAIKGIYFLSLEYLFFIVLASYGLYNWKKQLLHG
jgi:nicotinamide mononucleotide transporter